MSSDINKETAVAESATSNGEPTANSQQDQGNGEMQNLTSDIQSLKGKYAELHKSTEETRILLKNERDAHDKLKFENQKMQAELNAVDELKGKVANDEPQAKELNKEEEFKEKTYEAATKKIRSMASENIEMEALLQKEKKDRLEAEQALKNDYTIKSRDELLKVHIKASGIDEQYVDYVLSQASNTMITSTEGKTSYLEKDGTPMIKNNGDPADAEHFIAEHIRRYPRLVNKPTQAVFSNSTSEPKLKYDMNDPVDRARSLSDSLVKKRLDNRKRRA